ncbi:hypothetical protein [Paracoccus yeei]|uniref:DUF7946 domain-containing protein n=1 Tax=Paracoccus yeei TaxID=147645 RepID=UPI003BF7AAB8
MKALAEHRIRIKYEGGLADQNYLPGYDGATSIDGITRAFHIITHAYMTGEVVGRATALKNATILLKPARQGSFIFDLVVLIEAKPATTGLVAALGAPMFYDFVKTAIRRATGYLEAEPETTPLQNIYNRKEPPPLKKRPADLDELAEILEGSLQAAHRPLGEEGTIRKITVGTPRSELVVLNDDSKDWVNTREEAVSLEVVRGNVTRYNTMSRNARVFVDQFGRIVPLNRPGFTGE